jgi:acyl-CoA thioester hydrolase
VSAPQSTSRVRVRYAETDTMGVVYYANYLVWFEVARTDLLREHGWTYREMEEAGFALPVVEAHCEYRSPARYDDDIEIVTTGERLSPVRVRFIYRVQRVQGNLLLAEGYTVHATLDRSGKPTRLPARAHAVFAHRAESRAQRGLGRRAGGGR